MASTPDPSAVSLVVDGETDVCSRSQDVNFDLLGFTVYGQVLTPGWIACNLSYGVLYFRFLV